MKYEDQRAKYEGGRAMGETTTGRSERRRDRNYLALLLVMGLAMAWVGQARGGEPLVSRDAGFFGGDHDLVGEVERPAVGMLSVAQRLGVGILAAPGSVLELRATTDDYYTTLLTTGTEMVVNGGLETWPDGWFPGIGVVHTGPVHSGSSAVKISAGYNTRTYPNTTFDPMKQYQLTFWTRGDGTFAGGYTLPGGGTYSTAITSTTYQKVSRVFGPGIVIGFVSFFGSTGDCWVDDVSIKSISTLVFHAGDDLIRGETSATSLTFRLHETGDMTTSGTVTALDFATRKTTATLPVQNAHRAHVSDWTDNARWAVVRDIPTTVTAPNVTNSHKAHLSDYATRAGTANAVPWVGISGVPTTMTAAQNAHKAHTLDWPTTATTNISGWAHNARNAGRLGEHLAAWFEPALPSTPSAPTTKFLDGNREWNAPPSGGGGAWISGLVASTGSGATICSGTVPANGGFEVGGFLQVDAYTGGALALYCDYTDIDNNSITGFQIPIILYTSHAISTSAGAAGRFYVLVTSLYAKSGTTITLRTFVGGTLTYRAQGWIKKM